jgi:hypothetical protein
MQLTKYGTKYKQTVTTFSLKKIVKAKNKMLKSPATTCLIYFQCIGYWKENLKSYLITYDQLDAFTKYRCWVYQRFAIHF